MTIQSINICWDCPAYICFSRKVFVLKEHKIYSFFWNIFGRYLLHLQIYKYMLQSILYSFCWMFMQIISFTLICVICNVYRILCVSWYVLVISVWALQSEYLLLRKKWGVGLAAVIDPSNSFKFLETCLHSNPSQQKNNTINELETGWQDKALCHGSMRRTLQISKVDEIAYKNVIYYGLCNPA